MVKCERQSIDTRALFVFIGAVPNTAWLAGTIELDDHGFIPTGPAALYSDGDGEKRRRRQPMMLETSQPGVFTAGDVRSGSVNSSRSPVSQAPTNAGSARAGLKLLPDAAVTESEAGGGAKPGLPLPMGQLAQPFPAYLAQLPLGVTLPPLDPGSLNSIALKSLWVGMQLLAAHRRSCGQPSSHQTSRRDTAGRTKKIGHDGETKSDGHRVRRTHHPQVADRRVDIGFENVQMP